MTKIYSMKNKHPERQPQKAISSGCSFQRYFSSSLLLVIHDPDYPREEDPDWKLKHFRKLEKILKEEGLLD